MANESLDDLELARVIVKFASSTSKDGRESYSVTVLEGASEAEGTKVMALAKRLRTEALEAIKPPSLEQQLAESLRNGGKA